MTDYGWYPVYLREGTGTVCGEVYDFGDDPYSLLDLLQMEAAAGYLVEHLDPADPGSPLVCVWPADQTEHLGPVIVSGDWRQV